MPRAFEREQPAGDRGRVGRCSVMADLRSELELDHVVGSREWATALVARLGEHGEDAAADPAGTHPRQIEVTVWLSLGEAIVAALGERVVVAVEDREGRRHERGLSETERKPADRRGC